MTAERLDTSQIDRSLSAFVTWVDAHITGDEKGQAQIYLDRLFQAFGHQGCLEVDGRPEWRIRKGKEEGGGTAFADYVWKPVVLIEMKKRGVDLSRHYRQAFDYWTRLVPGRPRYVILCNFDELWVYDFETQIDSPLDKVSLADLPKRYGPLAFLLGVPSFSLSKVTVGIAYFHSQQTSKRLIFRTFLMANLGRSTPMRFKELRFQNSSCDPSCLASQLTDFQRENRSKKRDQEADQNRPVT